MVAVSTTMKMSDSLHNTAFQSLASFAHQVTLIIIGYEKPYRAIISIAIEHRKEALIRYRRHDRNLTITRLTSASTSRAEASVALRHFVLLKSQHHRSRSIGLHEATAGAS